MAFLLADSFQSSLDKLSGEEQKAAKLAAFELQINPANPGLQCHRLDNIKDKNFWSARASRDIRLIFHRVESSVMSSVPWSGVTQEEQPRRSRG